MSIRKLKLSQALTGLVLIIALMLGFQSHDRQHRRSGT